MRKILYIFLSLGVFLIIPDKTLADVSCQPIYGGGQTCTSSNNISIDKKVLNPKDNKMVDNLGINDPKYQPGFIVTFQIKVTNTGNGDFAKVNMKDIFPQYISYSNGPGNYDANTKILTFSLDNLKVNASKTFTIMGKVMDEKDIPFNNGSICVMNQAFVTTNTNQTAQDNTQFCIEKKNGFPVMAASTPTKTPATGPESLALFSLIPTAITGWALRKYSRKVGSN